MTARVHARVHGSTETDAGQVKELG
jgi:hypothetical protein